MRVTKRIYLRECYHDGMIINAKACKDCSIHEDYGYPKSKCKLVGYIEILPEQEKHLGDIIAELNNGSVEWWEQVKFSKNYQYSVLDEIYQRREG